MKSTIILALASIAIAAPTPTIQNRQLPGLGSSTGTSSGLDALKSLIPGLSGSGSSSDSSSSLGSGLDGLKSLIPGLSGSGTSSSDASSSSGTPSATSSGSGLDGFKSLIPGTSLGRGLSIPGLSSGSSTENGVTENAGCKEYTFIFARGTTEIGNMGTVIGPPLAEQLNTLTGDKVTVQGVDYPADAAGNAVMGAAGGPAMAKLVKQALSQCPKTKVLLGGYSQGAMVVHNAASTLTADQITAAVLFGDPLKAQSVGQVSSDKVKEFCHLGDPVCLNGVNGMAHITYGTDAAAAGKFLIEAAGGSTSS
ncbi:Cutinase [Penicillium camemberti]|uniref:cutinase n=1 Tax=Penicillium camemberti (strain FM 013) TaxID=1429867 RepID=A0A0G4PUR7_PENC3|nr:Cutinase [Penicillium camemberti]